MNDANEPLRKHYHVLGKQTFEEVGDGIVRVTDLEGRWGLFRWTGEYIEGELTQCSQQMLRWVGGPNIPKECNYRWTEVPADINRESGWPEHLEKYIYKKPA